MKKLIIIALLSFALFPLTSCSVSKAALDTTRIKAGMSKKDVIGQLGKPYKTEFFTNEYNEVIERFQYVRFVLGNPYEVHYLEFRDDKLIALTSPPPLSHQQAAHTNELQP